MVKISPLILGKKKLHWSGFNIQSSDTLIATEESLRLLCRVENAPLTVHTCKKKINKKRECSIRKVPSQVNNSKSELQSRKKKRSYGSIYIIKFKPTFYYMPSTHTICFPHPVIFCYRTDQDILAHCS